MGWFSKKKQVISGGNSFDVAEQLDAAKKIALDNLLAQTDYEKADSTLGIIKNRVDDKLIQPYFLLQLQGYYFTNLILFETDDEYIFRIIKDVIKGCWLFGKAGITKINGKYVPIYINKLKTDMNGNPSFIQYCSLYAMLDSSIPDVPNNMSWTETVNKNELENVAIFKWGNACLSAWLVIYPFVKYQYELLSMLIVTGYSYNKKWTYNIKANGEINPAEIQSWFNPYNFFIINRSGVEINSKFKAIDMGNSNITPMDFIEFYKEVVNSYYEIIGRRINTEKKAERNLTDEIENGERVFNNFEKEINEYFKIFQLQCKKIGLNFEIKEKENMENDSERIDSSNNRETEPKNPKAVS